MTSGHRFVQRPAGACVTMIVIMKARGDRHGLFIASTATHSRYV